jgi:hypothetical protein
MEYYCYFQAQHLNRILDEQEQGMGGNRFDNPDQNNSMNNMGGSSMVSKNSVLLGFHHFLKTNRQWFAIF